MRPQQDFLDVIQAAVDAVIKAGESVIKALTGKS